MSALKSEQQIAPSELFNSVTTQGTDLGARFTTGDGRVFRYVQGSNVALVAGTLQQSYPQQSANWQGIGVTTAGTGTFVVNTQGTASLTIAANLLTGGVLTVRAGQGVGYTYRIKSNTTAAAGTCTFTLEDPLQVALLSTTSAVDVTPNPYYSVIQQPATASGIPVGVATNVTAGSNFGWVQTRGVCNVLIAAPAPAVGQPVTASIATAGAVNLAGGTTAVLGYAMISTAAANYAPVFLTLE